MVTIYFVRHGQDRDNVRHVLNGRRNQPLTALGKKQAKLAGQKLKNKKIEHIYVSPLKRCRQTAAIINKELGNVSVTIEPLLIERDFGVLTGRPEASIPEHTSKILRSHDGVNYFLDGKGTEPFSKVYSRAQRALKKISRSRKFKTVLIVAHNDIGKMLQAITKKITIMQSLKTKHISNAEVLVLSRSSRKYGKK